MKIHFVSYEMAKKLAELGFPQIKSLYYYSTFYEDEEDFSGDIVHHFKRNTTDKDITKDSTIIRNVTYPLYNAPTLALASEWLRTKGIDILPYRDNNHGQYCSEYVGHIVCDEYGGIKNVGVLVGNYPTYYKALRECIKKGLEILEYNNSKD